MSTSCPKLKDSRQVSDSLSVSLICTRRLRMKPNLSRPKQVHAIVGQEQVPTALDLSASRGMAKLKIDTGFTAKSHSASVQVGSIM